MSHEPSSNKKIKEENDSGTETFDIPKRKIFPIPQPKVESLIKMDKIPRHKVKPKKPLGNKNRLKHQGHLSVGNLLSEPLTFSAFGKLIDDKSLKGLAIPAGLAVRTQKLEMKFTQCEIEKEGVTSVIRNLHRFISLEEIQMQFLK